MDLRVQIRYKVILFSLSVDHTVIPISLQNACHQIKDDTRRRPEMKRGSSGLRITGYGLISKREQSNDQRRASLHSETNLTTRRRASLRLATTSTFNKLPASAQPPHHHHHRLPTLIAAIQTRPPQGQISHLATILE